MPLHGRCSPYPFLPPLLPLCVQTPSPHTPRSPSECRSGNHLHFMYQLAPQSLRILQSDAALAIQRMAQCLPHHVVAQNIAAQAYAGLLPTPIAAPPPPPPPPRPAAVEAPAPPPPPAALHQQGATLRPYAPVFVPGAGAVVPAAQAQPAAGGQGVAPLPHLPAAAGGGHAAQGRGRGREAGRGGGRAGGRA